MNNTFSDHQLLEHFKDPCTIISGELFELNEILRKENNELRKAHKELKSIFENINEVLFSVDMLSYRVTQMSAACEKVYGYMASEFLADHTLWQAIIHPEDVHIAEQQLELQYQGKEVLNQFRIIHKDKSIRWTENKIVPTMDATGRLIRIDGLASDITERKLAEYKMQESELRYRSLIEQATDAICIADMSMKVIDINPSGCQLLGYSKEEFLTLTIADLFLPGDLKANPLKTEELKTGKSINNERRFIKKDGTIVEVELNGKLLDDGRFILFGRDISERKQAEKSLKESELRYRLLVDQATDAICVADASLRFIDLNPYACEFLGYTREEGLQLFVTDVLFPEDLITNPIHKFITLKTKETIRNERRFKRKDGSAVVMEISTKLMEDGKFIMFGHDVSDRKRSEEALRESKQHLRQIIDLVPHFIFAKDDNGKFVLVNEAVAAAYGSTVENLIGKSDADFNSNNEEVEHFLQEDLKVINSGNTKYNIEETITDATGQVRVLSTTKIPYMYLGANTPGVLGVSVDISERKKAEIILKESQGQLSIATEIAKLGYWEFDVTKNLFNFNNQFFSIFRTTAEKAGGNIMSSEQYVTHFVHPEDIQLIAAEGAAAIKSPDPKYNRQIEHRIKYADGGIGYVAVRFFIVKNELGRTIKVFGAVQDITERKKAEETIFKSEANLNLINKQLEIKNKELEHFAYVASHDLQEPLRTTTSFVNLLREQYQGKLDERADKYLNFISDSSGRMKVLITDMLDYSRIGNKKELQQVECNTVVNQVLQDLAVVLNETGAIINVDTLPVLSGYQTELKQLFQNLVTNAIKFRKKDTVPEVSISARRDKTCWTFAVSDNGIGIEKNHKDRIFIIFQRLHTRSEYEGTGIGLAHCKKIVGLHGGDIWIESTPGEGSIFYFTIPLNKPE